MRERERKGGRRGKCQTDREKDTTDRESERVCDRECEGETSEVKL